MRDESRQLVLSEFLAVARSNLSRELARHRSRHFPPDVEKGFEYGSIEPVMADADLFGWASTVAGGGSLTEEHLVGLAKLWNDVVDSLDELPTGARSYFGDLAAVATHAHMIEWLRTVGRRFVELEGASITGWSGVEMALREVGDDGLPQFNDPEVPFTQLLSLDVEHDAGRFRVTSSQHDDIFGLYLEPAANDEGEFDGIYRSAAGFDAPVGVVERVEVMIEEGVIAEVQLTVAGRRMLLMAGEVEEGPGTSIKLRRLDESVLLFADSADVAALPWLPPRRRPLLRG